MYGGRNVQGLGPGKSCFQCPLLGSVYPARMFDHVPADCCLQCLAGRSPQCPFHTETGSYVIGQWVQIVWVYVIVKPKLNLIKKTQMVERPDDTGRRD